MLTTLTWWGIGGIVVTTTLAIIIITLVTRKSVINKKSSSDAYKKVGITGLAAATITYIGFYIYTIYALGTRVALPSIWCGILIVLSIIIILALKTKDPQLEWKPASYTQALNPASTMVIIIGATIFCTLNWWVTPTINLSFSPQTSKSIAFGESPKSILVRSKLIEQNTQHTEADGETFLGAGSFTLKSESDFKIYHVWQERDQDGTLHVNVAQDGEGKDDTDVNIIVHIPKGAIIPDIDPNTIHKQ